MIENKRLEKTKTLETPDGSRWRSLQLTALQAHGIIVDVPGQTIEEDIEPISTESP
jgi:hypothetical protein